MTGETMTEKTPYARGFEAGRDGKPGPAFPTPDSSWADRIYARGWIEGADARQTAEREFNHSIATRAQIVAAQGL